ncbi:uncharacterized protein LOC110265239 [Arachis ipaensis]|uniref:uncharacterized protein LOC110265239 n=1 Tax=Arachis ipaensis TaxID=130454 RepID=UPI000A2B22CE|nr:uncharacterized protein LOC110265239 [Arachis ipaensis]
MFPTEEEQVKEKEKDKHQEEDDLLNRCPFLIGTFRFGSGVGRIPVVSESAVQSAVGCLGESAVKRWDDKWKNLQIQEMQNYLAQLNFIRHQTLVLFYFLYFISTIKQNCKSNFRLWTITSQAIGFVFCSWNFKSIKHC